MKAYSIFIITFTAIFALRYRYFFDLDLHQYTSYQKKGAEGNMAVMNGTINAHYYSQFTPTANKGTSSSSWTLPNTIFTPHIYTLVDFFKKNHQFCHGSSDAARRTTLIHVAVHSPNSVPVFTKTDSRGRGHGPPYDDVFDKSFYPERHRTFPTGNLTIAMSVNDREEITNRCSFANSAPGGHHSVFNMQDIGRWSRNDRYPSPLPWNQRESIPVFRGNYWGHPGHIKKAQEELEHNLQNGMTAHAAGNIFFERFLMTPDKTPEDNNPNVDRNSSALSSDNGRQRRISLVHFSKLHPELANARLTKQRFNNNPLKVSIWKQNATNGMFRVLPFDKIPEDKYYTEYQSHIVMGGIGAAFRTARLMNQGIAVILQDFPYEEWYTHLMIPFVHYIPLEQNLSDLNETLYWVRDNPSKVFDIAKNGKLFYDEYLSYDRMGEFYYELLFRLMLCCGGGDKHENGRD